MWRRASPPDARAVPHALLMAVAWPPAVTAVFLPLAVRRFQRLRACRVAG